MVSSSVTALGFIAEGRGRTNCLSNQWLRAVRSWSSRVNLAALARREAIYKTEKFSDHAPITMEYELAI